MCRESDFNLTGSDRGLPDIFDDYYAQMVNVTFNCSNSCNETVRMRQKYGEEASSVIGEFIWVRLRPLRTDFIVIGMPVVGPCSSFPQYREPEKLMECPCAYPFSLCIPSFPS